MPWWICIPNILLIHLLQTLSYKVIISSSVNQLGTSVGCWPKLFTAFPTSIDARADFVYSIPSFGILSITRHGRMIHTWYLLAFLFLYMSLLPSPSFGRSPLSGLRSRACLSLSSSQRLSFTRCLAYDNLCLSFFPPFCHIYSCLSALQAFRVRLIWPSCRGLALVLPLHYDAPLRNVCLSIPIPLHPSDRFAFRFRSAGQVILPNIIRIL